MLVYERVGDPISNGLWKTLPVKGSNIIVHRLKNIDDRLNALPVLVRLQSFEVIKRECHWSDGTDKLIKY